MANEEHLAILKKGVAAWKEWKPWDLRPDLSEADLGGANLVGANLIGANLSNASLMGAHLNGADLVGADLSGANLSGADLTGAHLTRAELCWASLSGANLTGANLIEANLSRARISETDFGAAALGSTILANVDLSTASGLETVQHHGPSTIGVDTIYRSQGKIPEVFLRGAGLPDEFIAYIGSFVGRPIQFYSCFISYSTKDQEFADRLYEGLQNKGVRCWFAPHDVKAGEKLHEQISEAIRLYDKLLLILSEDSMNSEWVKTEIFNAREREVAERKRKLFPVRLVGFEALRDWECFDADNGQDLAREIRGYFIPDFSTWKDHDSFQGGFERLLKDLKSPDAAAKSAAITKD